MSDRPPSDDDTREPDDQSRTTDGSDSPRTDRNASGRDDDADGLGAETGEQGDGAGEGDASDADDTVELLGRPVGRRTLRIAVAILAVLSLLYSLLIAGQILLWVTLIAPFVFLYLLWRFVRAHERIAAAQERREAAAEE